MKIRPILFSAPMVLALLAGRKTQTRRILKHEYADDIDVWAAPRGPEDNGLWEGGVYENGSVARMCTVKCHHGEPGDQLWVRETFAEKPQRPGTYAYRADGQRPRDYAGRQMKWKPSIFMPRAASRIRLDMKAVRVERLITISEADAIAEGIELRDPRGLDGSVGGPCYGWPGNSNNYASARAAYLAGWDSINGAGSSARNPWVWVESFAQILTGSTLPSAV